MCRSSRDAAPSVSGANELFLKNVNQSIHHRAAFDIARSRDADDDDDADGADGASSRLVVVVVVVYDVVVYDDDDDDDETRTMDARVRTRSLERSRRGNTAAETSRGRDGDAGET